ncbi:ATP-binding cassette domain-containing protein [Caldicellulosiruptoraceae bacterium PP1]
MKAKKRDGFINFYENEFISSKVMIILFSGLSYIISIIVYIKAEIIRNIIDFMGKNDIQKRISWLCTLIILVFIMECLLKYLYIRIKYKVKFDILQMAEEKLVKRNSLCQKWIDTELQLTDKYNIIRDELEQATDEYLNTFVLIYSNIFSLLTGIIYSLNISINVTIVILSLCVVFPIIGFIIKDKIEKNQINVVVKTGKFKNLIINMIENIEVIRSFLNIKKLLLYIENENKNLQKEYIKNQKLFSMVNSFQNMVSYSSIVFIIIASMFLIYKKDINIGDIYALLTVATTINNKAFVLINSFNRIPIIKGLMTRILNYYKLSIYEPKIFKEDIKENIDKNISIKINGISYKYKDKDAYVLDNFSKVFTKGKVHVITGESGCGKSTLLKLIANLLPIEKGTIEVFGYDISMVDRNKLWDYIEYIPQNLYFIDGTIEKNITLFQVSDKERLSKALKKSCLEKTIERYKEGINTNILSDGYPLSTGEKKKVCLARAIYNEKPIWLLDETINGIDIVDTQIIVKNLKDLAKEKNLTIIIVSHNQDLIKMCDEIHPFLIARMEAESNVTKST